MKKYQKQISKKFEQDFIFNLYFIGIKPKNTFRDKHFLQVSDFFEFF